MLDFKKQHCEYSRKATQIVVDVGSGDGLQSVWHQATTAANP